MIALIAPLTLSVLISVLSVFYLGYHPVIGIIIYYVSAIMLIYFHSIIITPKYYEYSL